MLDIVSIFGVLALFALVTLIAKTVERLGPGSGGPARRGATRGQERR